MLKILVKFIDQPVLEACIDDNIIGHQYYNLVKENYLNETPIFRDCLLYTTDYMHTLATQAKKILGWDWYADQYSIDNTVLLHKNIEELVGNGFDSIPEEYDNLIHELHYCLHIIQDTKTIRNRDAWLQIEWYNDSGFDLPKDYKFKKGLEFGDIKLQNPWVGHGPLQLFLEKDFTNISQTCKFHNFVKPGINIVTSNFEEFTNIDQLILMFQKYDPAFVEQHGIDRIEHYTGYPVIGRVINLNDLQKVILAPQLNLEWIKFE